MTSNLSTSSKLDLFQNFIQRWQDIVNSEVILLSTNGAIITASSNTPQLNWSDILQKTKLDQSSQLSYQGHSIFTTPLIIDQKIEGQVLALDIKDTNTSLLPSLTNLITERLVDEIALRGMTDELIGAWDQLELIYRVTKNLTLTSDLVAALHSILQEIRKVIDTENSFILLKRSNHLESVTAKPLSSNPYYDKNLLNTLASSEQVALCNDVQACRELWPEAPDHIENMLATALPGLEDGAQAVIGLVNKANQNFSAGDVKLLAALAQQIGSIIKNFLIHEKLIIEGRLSRELEIAAEIQESLLPTNLPQMGNISMAVSSSPASEVGGDFYDFITVDDCHLTLVMGDVSGKGIPAAMLTSVTRTILRVEAMRGASPQEIIEQANHVLHQDLSRADSFVTVFVATVDTKEGTLEYASAGHTPVLLWRDASRTTEQLRSTALPIGIFGYNSTKPHPIKLQEGDTLLLYTDGITEAQSPNGDLFGLNRLMYILESRANEPPEQIQQFIQSEISAFRRGAKGGDDATMLILKLHPQSTMAKPQDISTVIKTIDFSYPADLDHLNEITAKITESCRMLPSLPSGFNGDDFVYLIELAISEICTNIIKHAYAKSEGNLDGCITLLNNGIQLDFYDTGESFDPNTVPQPKTDPYALVEGGYGLHIVRQIMDVVSYEHHPKRGNHWYLLKLLPTKAGERE